MLGRSGRDFGRMGLVAPSGHFAGASLDLKFAASSGYPSAPASLLTTTRASDAYADDTAGNWTLFSSNVPRLTDKGLLVEESRTNLFLNSGAPATQSITVANGSVYTVSVIGTGSVTLSGAGSGTVSQGSPVTFTASTTSLTCTTAGITGAFVNVNVELGSFATSPIRTTGASATRAADAITVNNFSSWYNQSAGTFFAQWSRPVAFSGNSFVLQAREDGSNGIDIWEFSGDGNLYRRVLQGGANQLNQGSAYTDGAGPYKAALAATLNDAASSMDGSSPTTDTSVTMPSPTALWVGSANASAYLNGYIRRVAYFPTRLTNAQLQALTA